MKNVINLFSILSMVALLGFTTTASAQQKIAHINSDDIIQAMPEYKQAKANVESFSKVLSKQLEAKQQEIETYYTSVMKEVQGGTMPPIKQKEAEAKLAQMQQDLQKEAASADQKLVEKEQALTKPLYDKFNTALEKVASANGFAYIMDVKLALYSKGGIDATELVKKELGI